MPKPKARPKGPTLVGLHMRVPEPLYKQLLTYRDQMRKQNPMRNLSDAGRALFEAGLKAVGINRS